MLQPAGEEIKLDKPSSRDGGWKTMQKIIIE